MTRIHKYILPVVLLLSVACNNDEPTSANTDRADAGIADGKIGFAVSSQTSRALNSYSNTNLPDYFRVWAKMNLNGQSVVYMNGDELTRDVAGSFNYVSIPCYWPFEGDALDFYAVTDRNKADYTDYNKPFLTSIDDGFAMTYTVNRNASMQTDLLYAIEKNQTYATSPVVKLNFKHALSRVSFKIQSQYSKYVDVYLKQITISNANYRGTCSFRNDNCEWSSRGSVDFNIIFSGDGFKFNSTDGMVEVGETDASGVVNKEKSCLMMIPQEIEELSVSITVAFKAKDNGASSSLPSFSDNRTYQAKIKNIKWEPGESYSYSLSLSAPDHFNINGHEAVLMRSNPPLYMGTDNIKNAEGQSLFFWWGDTEGHINNANFAFSPNNRNILTKDLSNDISSDNPYTKYADAINGNPDKIILKPEYDVATLRWGSPWHMPKEADIIALLQFNFSTSRFYQEGDKFILVSLSTYDFVEIKNCGSHFVTGFNPLTWLQGSQAVWNSTTEDYSCRVFPVYINANGPLYGAYYNGLQVRPFATPPSGTEYEIWSKPAYSPARSTDDTIINLTERK